MHLASGMLLAVDNQIDQTTGTVRLKATFDNRDRALFPSQFVNVQILADVRRNQIVLPAAAVQQGPEGAFVYTAHDGQATVRPVTVGAVSGDLASITQGLEPGTSVVVDGTDRLRDGSAVQIQNDASSARTPS
jgi:membrane fusion protein, multidrug efflux system